MNDFALFAVGSAALAGFYLLGKRAITVPTVSIPSDEARTAAATITNMANSFGCNRIPAELIASFQTAMNPWLSGVFPALRTDGVLDHDTAAWIDDVDTFYNGMHGRFTCQGT